jgi:aspartate/methionine/tyrosine aminotransferase
VSEWTDNVYDFAFEILKKTHVAVTPGVDFGSLGEGYIRFSYANSLDNIKEAMARLREKIFRS